MHARLQWENLFLIKTSAACDAIQNSSHGSWRRSILAGQAVGSHANGPLPLVASSRPDKHQIAGGCSLGKAIVLFLFVVMAFGRTAFAASENPRRSVRFPEYDPQTACVGHVLMPSPDCMEAEAITRRLLLSNWAQIESVYDPMASSCVSLLTHPDAAPASYAKLLACMAGELYADE